MNLSYLIKIVIICTFAFLLNFTNALYADFDDTVPTQPAINTPAIPLITPKPLQKAPQNSIPSPIIAPAPSTSESNTASQTISNGGADALTGNMFSQVTHNSKATITWSGNDFQGSRGTGLLTLTKNVIVTQDNLTMKSDVMDIFISSIDKKPEKLAAKDQVHFRKDVDLKNNDIIEGWAARMDYNFITSIMVLTKNAKITRGPNCNIAGDILIYNLKNGTISGTNMHGACLPPNNSKKP